MKHFGLCRTLPCLLLVLALLLCSCGGRLVSIVAEQGDTARELFRNERTGAVYQVLPASYEPVARGEQYGRSDIGGVEFTLYGIPGHDPNEWLCSEWGDVYCDSSYDVLPFEQWDVDALYVCTGTATVVAELTFLKEGGNVQPELCERLFSLMQQAYQSGPNVRYPSYETPARSYTLRFATNEYGALYYSVRLIEYAEDIFTTVEIDGEEQQQNLGRTLLYDRHADRCVPVSDVIFRMLDGATPEEALGE